MIKQILKAAIRFCAYVAAFFFFGFGPLILAEGIRLSFLSLYAVSIPLLILSVLLIDINL